jgi:hypothetical protein
MTDHQILVHHLDIAGDGDVARLDLSRAGGRQLEALGALTLHAQGDLLHVQHDVGHVLADASQAGELMQDILDLDRGDRRALKRGEQHATQRVAERQAEATLERLGDEGRAALPIGTRLDLEGVGLLQFLPVLDVDSHGLPLGLFWRERPRITRVMRRPCRKATGAETGARHRCIVRRDDAWRGERRCAGSASRRGST